MYSSITSDGLSKSGGVIQDLHSVKVSRFCKFAKVDLCFFKIWKARYA